MYASSVAQEGAFFFFTATDLARAGENRDPAFRCPPTQFSQEGGNHPDPLVNMTHDAWPVLTRGTSNARSYVILLRNKGDKSTTQLRGYRWFSPMPKFLFLSMTASRESAMIMVVERTGRER